MNSFFEQIFPILKTPFMAVFKTFFTVLNLFPLKNVHEIHPHPAHGTENLAPRALHFKVRGDRGVHLGTFLLAYVRGKVFKAHLNSSGAWCWGVYDGDLEDIQQKWIW